MFDYARFSDPVAANLRGNVRRLRKALAAAIRPPERMSLSEWAPRFREFPEGTPYEGMWSNDTAPELVEIMDALSPEDPCEEVDLKKCAQSGGSASAENWIGFLSDQAPGPMLFVQASYKAALEWAAEKFWPMVDASDRLNPAKGGTIRPMGKADGDGSTKGKIRFAASVGYVVLAGANSSAGLRQKTMRYAIEDDLDDFPDDLNGQGSPESMVDARLKVYRNRGLSKRMKISTPRIKGASKIGRAYDTSDRRAFYLVCPSCQSRFRPEWEDVDYTNVPVEAAVMHPPCCGARMHHWQKAEAKRADGWLSLEIDGEQAPRAMSEEAFQAWRARMKPSRKRGFFLDGLISTFQSWGDMAVEWVAAQGDLNRLKTWTNLTRGLEFELKGDTPDYELLKELREQHWSARSMPIGPVVLVMGCDVQGDGIYLELIALGENDESWSLDMQFLPGTTDVKGEGAWRDLDAYTKRKIVYPGGREYSIDQICVDAGYHTEAAEWFCRAAPNRLPVFGRAGWTLPVLGRGENLRYEQQGRNAGRASKKAEDKAYIVGNFGVKLSFYGYLRSTLRASREEKAAGVPVEVRGRCHWHRDTPDDYFKQITSEAIVTETVNGNPRRKWGVMPGRENHWLDCRVYAIAAAEKLLVSTLSEAEWAALRAERYAPKDQRQPDMFGAMLAPVPPSADAAPPAPASPAAVPAPAGDGFIEHLDDWME